jgi:hypothetical protein
MSKRLQIYFAGSIRGGREDAALYRCVLLVVLVFLEDTGLVTLVIL